MVIYTSPISMHSYRLLGSKLGRYKERACWNHLFLSKCQSSPDLKYIYSFCNQLIKQWHQLYQKLSVFLLLSLLLRLAARRPETNQSHRFGNEIYKDSNGHITVSLSNESTFKFNLRSYPQIVQEKKCVPWSCGRQ